MVADGDSSLVEDSVEDLADSLALVKGSLVGSLSKDSLVEFLSKDSLVESLNSNPVETHGNPFLGLAGAAKAFRSKAILVFNR